MWENWIEKLQIVSHALCRVRCVGPLKVHIVRIACTMATWWDIVTCMMRLASCYRYLVSFNKESACTGYWKDKIEYLHISTPCPMVTRYPTTIHSNNPDFTALVHENFRTYPLLLEVLHPTWTSIAMFNLPGKFNTVMIFAFEFFVSGFVSNWLRYRISLYYWQYRALFFTL